MPKYETIILNEKSYKYLDDHFIGQKIDNPSQYVIKRLKNSICKIDVYKCDEGYKCCFCYEDKFHIDIYRDMSVTNNKFKNTKEQIGSDETGVGDYLLPLVVVATHFKNEDMEFLKKLRLTDSKKMDDDYIFSIGKKVASRFEHKKIIITNKLYEELITKGLNSKSINALCHNKVITDLQSLYKDIPSYIDQFTTEKSFQKYLSEHKTKPIKFTYFYTKGETLFPSIAVSSVLARYYLICYKNKLEKKYDLSFPFGAGPNVDAAAKKIIKKLGKKEAKNLMKISFKNTERVFK